MIDDVTKNKFLKELEKNGNVLLSCLKINIHRSTYYRWKKEDKKFREKAAEAEKHGRENNVDIGEHSLMKKVREGDLGAIKYLLGHISSKYRPKKEASRVIFVHEKKDPLSDKQAPTLEDLFQRMDERASAQQENISVGNDEPKPFYPTKNNGWPEEESGENNSEPELTDEDLLPIKEKREKPLSAREERLIKRKMTERHL